MALFENGDPEGFFLFVRNFNMTLSASGMMKTGAKVQHVHTLVRGEVSRLFNLFSTDVEGPDPLTVKTNILGLYLYFSPVNLLSNQKRAMCRGMRKMCRLKVRQYENLLIDLND